MSVYELIDYDRLLDRIGIDHAQKWFCGNNPAPELTYDELGIHYDDVVPYDGPARHGKGGLCLTSDININGLTFDTRDANGTIWLCTGVEGWWTLPPSESPDVPKPYWDGSLLTTGRYQSRMITVTGCFIPPDPSWVWYNRDMLLRVASIVRGVGLICMCGNESPDITSASVMYDPSKMAIIQMADVPLVQTAKSPNGFTAFSLSFRCSRPDQAVDPGEHSDPADPRRRPAPCLRLVQPDAGGRRCRRRDQLHRAAERRPHVRAGQVLRR